MRDTTWAILPRTLRSRLYEVASTDDCLSVNERRLQRMQPAQAQSGADWPVSESEVVSKLRSGLISESTACCSDLGVGAIRDGVIIRLIDGDKVTADIVEPIGPGPHPILVYFHGGGWCAGNARMYRALSFRMAEAGYLVFNIDYRLAPEARFPAGYEDCLYAVNWVGKNAAKYGGDTARIAVGGDSGGANLAAATAAGITRESSAEKIAALLLLYGAYDLSMASMSDTSAKSLVEIYLGNEYDTLINDPRVSPLLAVDQLPPCFVAVGTNDYALDQSEALVRMLSQNEIEHEYLLLDNVPHGYMRFEFQYQKEFDITFEHMLAFLDKCI